MRPTKIKYIQQSVQLTD